MAHGENAQRAGKRGKEYHGRRPGLDMPVGSGSKATTHARERMQEKKILRTELKQLDAEIDLDLQEISDFN
jgi:hypothetical protein